MLYLLIVLLTIVILLIALYLRFNNSVANIKRLDEIGSLYYGEYVKNYDNFLLHKVFSFMRGSQCTAFSAITNENDVLTGRNYDMPHFDKEEKCQGLNVVLRCNPKGKYSSINGVDANWLAKINLPFYRGALDTNVTKLPLALLPYLCMDGINEKGLTVSILALDNVEGEKPTYQNEKGKKQLTINELVRALLDNCADSKQAIKYIESINLVNVFNFDYHLFINDKNNDSFIAEWRYNTFTLIRQNVCTNFYNCYDDGRDCYYGKDLKEKFVKLENTKKQYHYGYGHGFGRFNKAVETLEANQKDGAAILSQQQAMDLLSKVAQDYTGMNTSFTQYSVVYNSTKLTASYACQQDYQHIFTFKI